MNPRRRLSWVVLSGIALSARSFAMESPLFIFPDDSVGALTGSVSEIRVRVFPHPNDFAPQGQDTRPDRTTLRSDGSCDVYAGLSDSPEQGPQFIETTKSLVLDVQSLGTPLWVHCSSPATIDREAGKTSYSYPGSFYIRAVSQSVEIINVLPLETYLKGVVPIEMPPSWHPEALKAQAVAARTYAYFHISLARSLGTDGFYDVDDTTLYQAYTGVLNSTAQTDLAVDETSGQLVTYQGKVIQAYFSADSGGYTEDAAHVFPVSAPYCIGKKEVYTDPGFDNGHWGPWSVPMNLEVLNAKLASQAVISASNPASSVWVKDEDRWESGRVKTVTLGLLDGTVTSVDSSLFRRALGLRSTLFTLDAQNEIQGRGFGHGVGMSQYGARVLAETMAWDYLGILGFYYTDVRVCTLDSATETSEVPGCVF